MYIEKLRLRRNFPEKTGLSELDKDIQELKANIKKRKLAKTLRIILIGFLFGRNTEQRILQLTGRIQNTISNTVSEASKIIDEIEESGTYLIHPKKREYVSRVESTEATIETCKETNVLKPNFLYQMSAELDQIKHFIHNYNSEFIEKRKDEYQYLWSKGAVSLDDEQQTAIVTDDKYNLVVAAAGSGKTEVLITRIAYLIKRKPDYVKPNRILAIAYQRKAKEQIEQRLQDRYGIQDVWARTFHKLGKDILESSGRIIERTDIIDENRKYGFVKAFFEDEIATNKDFYNLFIRYVVAVRDKDKEETETDKKAVLAHAKKRSYISINGIKVNSKDEKEIMDWLLTHKINGKPITVRYEPDIGDFRPDFYLPQYDIFMEHWGLNKEGKVPEWFNKSSEEYREAMKKKKKWFADNNRPLIETFAYEYNYGKPEEFNEILKRRLDEILKTRFPGKIFEFSSLTYEEILELVWDSQKTPIDDIQNFITIAKTYGLSPKQIEEKLEKNKWSSKQTAFGKLALHVFKAYQKQLKELGKTDFEDMINEASKALENDESLYQNVYDQILIDEYQDMSAQRLKLLKKLLERNPNCKLFCVGDDWQSIMGFSGANLNFFVNFGDYFENPAISKICTNYRSIKSIVEAGAELIKNNGTSQVQKPAFSNIKKVKPISICSSSETWDECYFEQTVKDCLARIGEYITNGYSPSDILVLTRYMRTKIKGRTRFFQIVQKFMEASKSSGFRVAIDHAKEPNAVRLLTVHKCKGLEAKVVFVLNVVKGEFGFPSEIEDPEIFEVAREDNGIKDQKEEERRLFYVAITRAKEDLYIYTKHGSKSEFLKEIDDHVTEIEANNWPQLNRIETAADTSTLNAEFQNSSNEIVVEEEPREPIMEPQIELNFAEPSRLVTDLLDIVHEEIATTVPQELFLNVLKGNEDSRCKLLMDYELAVVVDSEANSSFPISSDIRHELLQRIVDLIHKNLKPKVSKKMWKNASAPIHECDVPALLFSQMTHGSFLVTPHAILTKIEPEWKIKLART